jgi:HupE / UreJ protein
MIASACSADFQSAVSPTSSRQTVRKHGGAGTARAVRVGNPRYSRLETCAPLLCSLGLLLFISGSLFAHEMRPAYLELREVKPGEFSVLWKTPMVADARLSLAPEFSGDAKPATPVTTRTPPGAAVQTWTLRAPALRGQMLRIQGLDATMTDVLVRCEFADGSAWTQRLTPQQPSALIPRSQSAWAVAGMYIKLGIEHILSGIDHLLFVLALLIIVMETSGKGLGANDGVFHSPPATSHWPLLIKTVTAFTVSHSVTLSLATLGYVHIPQRPVEAVIALSIVFVASEILHTQRGRTGLTARAPWVVAFAFGLMHGLGFAGGLREAGLPVGHIPTALLFFSAGVEAGHFLFIGAVLAFIAAVRRIRMPFPRWAELVPPYAIGSVAMFWVLQRIVAF